MLERSEASTYRDEILHVVQNDNQHLGTPLILKEEQNQICSTR